MNPFLVKEAIASVALEHPQDHDCLTCRAARGDSGAMAEVMFMLYLEEERGR